MDTRRLAAFIKVADVGSVTRAASLLHIAQPALSQQMAALEADFGQQLLTRGPRGVGMTAAGRILYQHAHVMLRQEAEARRNVARPELLVCGEVCVGLAPFSSATSLAIPLLARVRTNYPGIVLHIRDYFGTVLSELILNGVIQMAVLYGHGPIRGLSFQPIAEEQWCLVGAASFFPADRAAVELSELADTDLVLASRSTYHRNRVEEACRQAGFVPRIVAELESIETLRAALLAGLGVSVLPLCIAAEFQRTTTLELRHIAAAGIVAPLSLCTKEDAALTPASTAVLDALRGEIVDFPGRHDGLKPLPSRTRA